MSVEGDHLGVDLRPDGSERVHGGLAVLRGPGKRRTRSTRRRWRTVRSMDDTPKADTASTPEDGPRARQSLLTLIPRLAKFLYHLAADERVPWTAKAALGGLAAYLASPVDVIPDAVPGGGYLDDLLLLSFVASFVLAKVPPEVVREHWGEDVEVLERMRSERANAKEE
jgi:uncharacterized membrane protein YkvA (DUF1232 family)